ncbi:MAG: hypothetical protein GY858_03335 [Candidatus Omnitrophica bacterium]|nr:hypothetical protein [Candidatus Omnitrophota bacterium]
MFNKISNKVKKRILWAVATIIIFTFVLGGAVTYLTREKNRTIGKIGKQKLTLSDASYYAKMSQLAQFLSLLNTKMPAIDSLDTLKNPGGYLVLLWKANQEKIKVSDEEVVTTIKTWFSSKGKFDIETYNRFLEYGIRMQPRIFEEYITDFLKIDKLFKKLIKIDISDDTLKEMYRKDSQEAKIAYVIIPYKQFTDSITTTDSEIEKFYKEKSPIFKEEPKVRIAYLIIPTENEKITEINDLLPTAKSLEKLASTVSLDIKKSDLIGIRDPIKGIGWQPSINKAAFSLKKDEISEPFNIDQNTIIIQKIEEKDSFIPKLEDVKDKVKEKIQTQKLQEKAKNAMDVLFEDIKKQESPDLKKIAKKHKVDFKETKYFRYNDYIEGVGLDRGVSAMIFSLEKDEIYPETILLLKGAYIIQLKDKTIFDEEGFKEKRQGYFDFIYKRQMFAEETNLLNRAKEESGFHLYQQPPTGAVAK